MSLREEMPRLLCSYWRIIRRSRLDQPPSPSTANQTLVPLVDQDVGDDRRSRWPQPVARFEIPGCQFVQFLPARGGSKEGSQFLLPLLERFLRGHSSSFSAGRAG